MSEASEIKAAIGRLRALKLGTVALPWEMDNRYVRSDGWILAQVMKAGNETTGELIVTLHATIGAQLELLNWALELYSLPNREHPSPLETRVLTLARAINKGLTS